MDENNVSQWIVKAKHGDSVAAHQLWQHYYDRLVRAARKNLGAKSGRMVDEEDIAISVFESFYRAARNGRFPQLSGRDDLWRLLLRMSARKIIDRRRHESRQRRGGEERVVSLQDGSDDEAIIDVIGSEPSPELVLMMTESFELLMSHLGDGSLREIAVAKMEGYSNAELAQRFGCSERTIERRLHLIREKCQQQLIDGHE